MKILANNPLEPESPNLRNWQGSGWRSIEKNKGGKKAHKWCEGGE